VGEARRKRRTGGRGYGAWCTRRWALDADAVVEAFLAAAGRGSGVERVMGLAWREAAVVRVERRPPEGTAAGTILHLRTPRAPATP
jgi:hypothetical protein